VSLSEGDYKWSPSSSAVGLSLLKNVEVESCAQKSAKCSIRRQEESGGGGGRGCGRCWVGRIDYYQLLLSLNFLVGSAKYIKYVCMSLNAKKQIVATSTQSTPSITILNVHL